MKIMMNGFGNSTSNLNKWFAGCVQKCVCKWDSFPDGKFVYRRVTKMREQKKNCFHFIT